MSVPTPAQLLADPDPHLHHLAIIAKAAVRAELLWLSRISSGLPPPVIDDLAHAALARAAEMADLERGN